MRLLTDRSGRTSSLRLIAIGIAAGIVNGLLGAGGGILIVFGVSPLLATDRQGQRDVFANALAVMMPVSIVSVISYILAGRLGGAQFGLYALPAALGGVLGAFLLDRINLTLLKRLFAVIVIWSGLYMLF